ncbi:SprT-like domain-containing protein [Aphelenchoides besseyi]|nr:SprT-like domain-containing protein [Aphelenchoides besseyi]
MGKKNLKNSETYDLWDVDPDPVTKTDQSDGAIHLLRQTGKLKSKLKSTYVHSVLPSIEIAKSGASYNPSIDDYMDYTKKIAKEEDVDLKKQRKAIQKMALREGETYCTEEDAKREELMGFLSSDEDVKSDFEIKTEPSDLEDEEEKTRIRKKPKVKTQKQRRKELERRVEELERLKTKRTKMQQAELNRVKSILKEVNKDLHDRAHAVAERRRKRILRRLIGTKRLGHGKFEEFKEPVLLPREIKGSLRTLKPQGNIFKERIASFQKRNMMQPPSFKRAKTLKTTLKFKVKDKREVHPLLYRNENQENEFVNLVHADAELLDPTPDLHTMFIHFDLQFFDGLLAGCLVDCAGICYFHPQSGLCTIRMSEPLLKLRPRADFVQTLLHEMIHAYLFVTARNTDRDGHGPVFQAHMNRINRIANTNITIYHTFNAEVALYKQHWWRCDGPCRNRGPFFGWVKRTMNRAPSSSDPWFASHQAACSGKFVKVKEPEKNEKSTATSTNESKPKGIVKKKSTSQINPSILPFLTRTADSKAEKKVELIDLTNDDTPSTSYSGVFVGQGRRLCD